MKSIKTEVIMQLATENGRACMPIGSSYSPHLVILDTIDYLPVRFINVPEQAQQGIGFSLEIELLYPLEIDYSKLKVSCSFEIIEGIRSIGVGTVTEGCSEYE